MLNTDPEENLAGAPKSGHKPVMLKEALEYLAPRDGETYLDCTFGGGGHSKAILESANCSLKAMDRDGAAKPRAEALKREFGSRFEFFDKNFSQLDEINTNGYAGVLMDLGVSSFQLDSADRGFSILRDGPLDMRMDIEHGLTALELIKALPLREIERIIREYGEDPRFKRIAAAVKQAALDTENLSTAALAEVIERAAPVPPYKRRIHPATKTFQALRIAVNRELEEIEEALPKAFARLKSGGVLAVISFHSLEDRIVKRFFKRMAGRPEDSFDTSFVQDRTKLAAILTNKPIEASEEEKNLNPRSRSAKLRALRKD